MNLFSKKAVSFILLLSLIIGSNSSYRSADANNKILKEDEITRVTATFYGDTTTSKGFTWYSSQVSVQSDLEIIEKTDIIPDFNHAIKFEGSCQRSTNAPDYIVHKAEATNLKPNTKYQYRVGDAQFGLWSEVGTFETSDTDGQFTFINLADSQAKTEEEAILSSETFKKANQTIKNSKFIILNGDIVDSGIEEEQWGWILDHSAKTLMNTTFVAAAGNHEDNPESFIEHFNLDTPVDASTTTGAYYSYNYENVHFIILNSNEDSDEFRDFTPAQIEWLEADVKTSKADKSIDWMIAVMHKGPYTTSGHATDDDIMNEDNGVRAKIAPLFNQLGLDLVLQGHDHIYARTQPIKDGVATEVTKVCYEYNGNEVSYSINPDGTIYLIPSTAGPKVYYKNKLIIPSYYDLFEVANEHSAAKYGADPTDDSVPLRGQVQNFVEFNIDGNKLTGITYEIDQSINNAEPYIVDTFGIIKEDDEVITPVMKANSEVVKYLTYTVKVGDNLYRIGLNHGTTYKEIMKENNVGDANLIYPGQVFKIVTEQLP